MRSVRSFDTGLRLAFTCVLLAAVNACTTQQYFEGLKAGRRAQCLEYPVSEFESCAGETRLDYHEYQETRHEVVGKDAK